MNHSSANKAIEDMNNRPKTNDEDVYILINPSEEQSLRDKLDIHDTISEKDWNNTKVYIYRKAL
jgi:hypothetical protein